jgi:hypothetical protein
MGGKGGMDMNAPAPGPTSSAADATGWAMGQASQSMLRSVGKNPADYGFNTGAPASQVTDTPAPAEAPASSTPEGGASVVTPEAAPANLSGLGDKLVSAMGATPSYGKDAPRFVSNALRGNVKKSSLKMSQV